MIYQNRMEGCTVIMTISTKKIPTISQLVAWRKAAEFEATKSKRPNVAHEINLQQMRRFGWTVEDVLNPYSELHEQLAASLKADLADLAGKLLEHER